MLMASWSGADLDRRADTVSGRARPAGARGRLAFALACLTRYEAWPVTVRALVAAVWARWRRGQPLGARSCARRRDRALPAARGRRLRDLQPRRRRRSGSSRSGFFVPENKALGHPLMARRRKSAGACGC